MEDTSALEIGCVWPAPWRGLEPPARQAPPAPYAACARRPSARVDAARAQRGISVGRRSRPRSAVGSTGGPLGQWDHGLQ
eukprot:11860831-Heterocapsa_arctica.AAC.1